MGASSPHEWKNQQAMHKNEKGADTVGRGLKELKETNVVYTCDKSKHAYKFNKAEKLNQPFEQ